MTLINNTALNVTKTLLSPTNTPVAVGSNVVFRIIVQNTGNVTVNYLPLEDTFSAAYYQFVSSTITNNGSGAGSLIWTNLASPVALAAGASITNDVTMTVVGQGTPANNAATVDYATDINGNPVPTTTSTIGVNTAAASITGHVYDDEDQSGVYNPNDPGLANVTLDLYTDPTATGMALASVTGISRSVTVKDLTGPLAYLAEREPPFRILVHRLYNPEGINQYNIVPGIMGVILTMMMVLMTGLAVTRERERGTMENLLAMPVRPLEVMTGKIVPYIAIGLIQATIIFLAARLIFHVPFAGSIVTMYLVTLLFVGANLTVGITISSLVQNQLQAMQLTMFYFLPNMLLSGFMFPFHGMPGWAQFVGNLLPLTYFNRLIRGIFLKGNSLSLLWPDIWPLMLFTLAMMTIAVKFYRKTLD